MAHFKFLSPGREGIKGRGYLIYQGCQMEHFELSDNDKKQVDKLGISEKQVISQIEVLKKGVPYMKLDRPCTVGDGIRSVSKEELKELAKIFHEYGREKKLVKFVPASGAASRMFKTLFNFYNRYPQIQRDSVALKAQKGDKDNQYLLIFMDDIRKFAFYDDLKSVMSEDGLDTDTLTDDGNFKEVIEYLLGQKGLGYTQLPKALLVFHKYPDGNRTAFEEHLVEAVGYARDINEMSHLHFTVSPEHKQEFEGFLKKIIPHYEEHYGIRFSVGLSVQERATDTIAVDLENKPFRLNDGTILFRPGGHGALIENLRNIDGDIIFIKNIDNVVHDRLKDQTFQWKKALGGYLIQIQQKIFSYLERLAKEPLDEELLDEAIGFAKNDLCIIPSNSEDVISAREKQTFLISKFNRPVRVCGMVRNEGEPGGGAFWVKSKDGSLSLQIVESAQIDPESEEQQSVFRSSMYFNPVDIVCGVRDRHGKAYDLRHYVDPEAALISIKSKDGRELKALELPGLWNGAMSDWNTIFVEVPLITFNPVKTMNDLLREQHQPA